MVDPQLDQKEVIVQPNKKHLESHLRLYAGQHLTGITDALNLDTKDALMGKAFGDLIGGGDFDSALTATWLVLLNGVIDI